MAIGGRRGPGRAGRDVRRVELRRPPGGRIAAAGDGRDGAGGARCRQVRGRQGDRRRHAAAGGDAAAGGRRHVRARRGQGARGRARNVARAPLGHLSRSPRAICSRPRRRACPRAAKPRPRTCWARAWSTAASRRPALRRSNEALRCTPSRRREIHALLVRAPDRRARPRPRGGADSQRIRDSRRRAVRRATRRGLAAARRNAAAPGTPGDAVEALAQVGGDGPLAGRRMLLLGRLLWDDAAKRCRPIRPSARRSSQAALEQFAAAQQAGRRERPADARRRCTGRPTATSCAATATRRSAQYSRLSNLYGDTDEGARRDAGRGRLRPARRRPRASARRRTARCCRPSAIRRRTTTRLLPLAELRARLSAAYQQFVGEEQFAEALAMLDLFEPVLGRAECTELRAKTHQQWGARRRDQAADEPSSRPPDAGQGRPVPPARRGRAYEDLARMRYATRYFTARPVGGGRLLLSRAELYQRRAAARGVSAPRSAAVERRGAGAVGAGAARARRVRRGHRRARRVHRDVSPTTRSRTRRGSKRRGRTSSSASCDEARATAARPTSTAPALTPASPEWRDSLFALGHLLYETERYRRSGRRAATRRSSGIPTTTPTLLAKYTIARAYHNGAEALAAQLREPSSDNEAQINRSRKLIERVSAKAPTPRTSTCSRRSRWPAARTTIR